MVFLTVNSSLFTIIIIREYYNLATNLKNQKYYTQIYSGIKLDNLNFY